MKKVSPELYPFTSHYLTIGGHQYHYVEEGSGDPVVMLHGNPSWSFYYRNLIQKLSPKFRCIAPDHIGMGYSDKPGDEAYSYTLAQRVRDLEEFLEAKGVVKDITLVLHDWGGIIGMVYARRHPDRIKRLVILNTAAFLMPKAKKLPFMLKATRTPLGAFFVRGFNAFSGGATKIGVKRIKMSKEVAAGYVAPYDSWKNRIATLRFVQDIALKKGDPGYDMIEDLENNLSLFKNTPVLIAWGLQDVVFDHIILDTWIRYMPQAEVHRFEDCGHYVLEDAQQEIGELVMDFLTR